MADNKVTYRIPAGKNSYVVSFRHPVVKDANGNGKKIQRGAGTSNEKEASRIADDLQEMISDERWHVASKKAEAMEQFDRIAVEAFFDYMPNVIADNSVLDVIPMNTLNDGYIKTVLMGMSGVGKSSLLRWLLGTVDDAFPATSTNRTTTSDLEVIKANQNEYELAVQFMSRNELESDLVDNILDSIEYIMTEARVDGFIDDVQLQLMIFNHEEMATRLLYTFGMPEFSEDNDEEDDEEEENDSIEDQDDTFALPEYKFDEKKRDRFIFDIADRVKKVAQEYIDAGNDFSQIEGDLFNNDEVLSIVDDIISAVIEKFDLLKDGKRTNPKATWPEGWYYKTENREEFIKTVKIFVSVSSKAWGKLLTPIVKALRVKGPFKEEGASKVTPGIIIDGMGFGHSTDYTSIPSKSIERCEAADVILFLDSAASPMMANAKDALKSLIEYGFADKIIVGFTKMDLVKGSNYRGLADKKAQAMTPLVNYLRYLRKQENTILSETEARSISESCIFFSKLKDKNISKITAKGLQELGEKTNAVVSKHITTDDISLTYEALKLYYYLKEATQSFRTEWGERTGYSANTSKTEHWSRIKALSRRLGLIGEERYRELQPLADFASIVQANVNIFINQPEAVTPEQTPEERSDELKRIIKREIGNAFRELNRKRMWTGDRPHSEWERAYNEKGYGSTGRRARIIENIFDEAAPNLADIPNLTEEQQAYLSEVIGMVENILEAHNCKLLRFTMKER